MQIFYWFSPGPPRTIWQGPRRPLHKWPLLKSAPQAWRKVTAAYRRVNDSHHLQADCQEPGSAPEPYALQSSMGYFYFFYYNSLLFSTHPVRLQLFWGNPAASNEWISLTKQHESRTTMGVIAERSLLNRSATKVPKFMQHFIAADKRSSKIKQQIHRLTIPAICTLNICLK